VQEGGVLYASDWTNEILMEAFGDLIEFEHVLTIGKKKTKVLDEDFKRIIGDEIKIKFDTPDWRCVTNYKTGRTI